MVRWGIQRKVTNKIMAIGAHPDDIELGCGGTIVKHLEAGDEVFVIIMTEGEQGGHALNREECLNSLDLLGIQPQNIFFGSFPDGSLTDNNHAVNFIEEIINRYGITKVYTHYPGDRHQDHRNCSNAVSSAARRIPEILLFEGPSTNVSFEPHYFIELSEEQIKKKVDSLGCYKSQINKESINLPWVVSLAKTHTTKTFAKYSEAFAINHILKKDKDV
ncbi:MAG: PIG-L family deacetylase [Nanoarchaeota archaeon]|nr:PIG-L family deacetylase [Nanoarchaeota archaeon]